MAQIDKAKPQFAPLPATKPFWDAAAEGRLLLKRCVSCGAHHFYPRPHCPFCGHQETEWVEVSGEGTIYSFSTVRGARRPMGTAIVDVGHDVRITSAIVDADMHALNIGDAVRVRFEPGQDGRPVPLFTTVAAEEARAYSRAALKATANVAGIPPVADAGIARTAVVGAGTMGQGIALALLNAGLPVTLVDTSAEALTRATGAIEADLRGQVEKGRLTGEELAARLGRLVVSQAIADIAEADLIIEAVWEQLALKQNIFGQMDAHAKAGAILASNTSTLDIDKLAQATSRPRMVVGLHFFSPAHVMKLLEVVRGPQTASETLARALTFGRMLRKVPVPVGVCDGFVGNRMMIARETQAAQLLLEGALPHQVDAALEEFGLPMGPFRLHDMAGGIELTYRIRKERGESDWLADQLFETGRLGQKVGKGYYKYVPGKRMPLVDDEVTALVEEASRRAGIARRVISREEMLDRLILPMINEGAKLIAEGMVERASDIDMVWQLGFGWPDWKGGPMYHADRIGAAEIVARLDRLASAHGPAFTPAPLLRDMAADGRRFTAPAP